MTDEAMAEVRASAAVAAYAEAQLGGPYIYGATAQECTIGYRLRRAEQYPEYADKIHGYCPALSGEGVGCAGCQWEGRKAHDCATLTRFAAEAAGLSLPSGATSQWEDGDWAASGLIADLPQISYISMLYRRSSGRMVHTGVYMGDGTVIEARGHKDGVMRSELGDYPWTHWAILRGMSCPPGATLLQALPLLRKGARGEDVVKLQEALIAAGYSCGALGADGVFGVSTRMAVMELQRDQAIGVDGVVGELTWAALDKLAGAARWTVTISGLTEVAAQRIVSQHGGQMTEEVTV